MDLRAIASLDVPRAPTVAALGDLATYPSWLTIVGSAARVAADAADAGPAWAVDLVGRVGPLVRRKRVRMVRTGFDPAAGRVRFERVEHDGREHNAWVLTAEVTSRGESPPTEVALHLHYGGGGRIPGADLLLAQEVRRAGGRLERYLREHP